MNALGNVYIIQKQKDSYECEDENRVLKEPLRRQGFSTTSITFRSPKKLAATYRETNSQSGVIWDIDLDYLTQEEEVPDQQYTPMLSNRAIRSLLSPRKEWMQIILGDPKAITIAMEPEYTGGLSCSLELYRRWETIFFCGSLFSKHCDWRDDLFDA